MIEHKSCTKAKLPAALNAIYNTFFNLTSDQKAVIKNFIAPLKKNAHFAIEYPYVDKVYRDSYYSYFSSKLNHYPRDCIRVSIFDKPVETAEFLSEKNHSSIKEKYRGYFVVRPTQPNIFGRTTIDKRIIENNDFLICETNFPTTCTGLKLSVKGFPYSSQDAETISCAETSLWSMMEYFSNRYAEYAPVLPSTIIEALKSVRIERQLPSLGLFYSDLSFALKTFGFGTRIYAKEQFKGNFESLLSCYVESGIPIIVAVSNKQNIHHAYICCGREKISPKHFKTLPGKKGIIDFDSIEKAFVFMDDNHFPYQTAKLKSPCAYYNSPDWEKCEIQYFIAPLYPKIYLEAFEAKSYCHQFVATLLGNNDGIILRTLLSSSRSFKDELLANPDLTDELKEKVIGTPMPKFIWISEITNKELLTKEKCFGTVILDATEPNINRLKPLITSYLSGFVFKKDKGLLSFDRLNKSIGNFNIYKNNLTGF
jgi:hypothetical protein